jgi:transcriptional regulator GlxA family with amidase domain
MDTAGCGRARRSLLARKALEAMQADPARAWSLESLATVAGVSRTALAEKFRTAMGDTPLAYLRALRMQKAMRLLSHTDRPLDDVAAEVGYTDGFSFSRSFKKTLGLAPREFRRRDAGERASPHRF